MTSIDDSGVVRHLPQDEDTPDPLLGSADGLPSGVALDAAALVIDMEPVPAAAVADGSPATGVHELGSFGGMDLGIWEMSEGGMFDTEVDEVFLVLSGDATVQFLAADGSVSSTASLGPHSLMRLAAGTRTRWTVSRTLRKLYLAPA